MVGFVVSFHVAKGFGFIRALSQERSADIFFHVKDVAGRMPLLPDDFVIFETRPSTTHEGRLAAHNIVLKKRDEVPSQDAAVIA